MRLWNWLSRDKGGLLAALFICLASLVSISCAVFVGLYFSGEKILVAVIASVTTQVTTIFGAVRFFPGHVLNRRRDSRETVKETEALFAEADICLEKDSERSWSSGIRKLQKISRYYGDDYWGVVERLCTYLKDPPSWKKYQRSNESKQRDFIAKHLREFLDERNRDQGERMHDMSRVNMASFDLRGCFLNNFVLNDSKLLNARLSGANLTGVSLRGADLRGADLRDADLREADFSDAILSEEVVTRIPKSDLEPSEPESDLVNESPYANLKGSKIRKAKFCNTIIYRADFSDVDLSTVDLRLASLVKCNLKKARLPRGEKRPMSLSRSIFGSDSRREATSLYGVSFEGMLLEGVDFRNCNLDVADFVTADISRSKFDGASLKATDFSRANLKEADFCGVDLSKARGLTAEQINSGITDEMTLLPEEF